MAQHPCRSREKLNLIARVLSRGAVGQGSAPHSGATRPSSSLGHPRHLNQLLQRVARANLLARPSFSEADKRFGQRQDPLPPLIMGILNVTPDSFSDGGLYLNPQAALARALQMVEEGADIIDIGGESSRPGASPVSVDEECRRVFPVIEAIRAGNQVPISIDTCKAAVAQGALERGATIVNDIAAGRQDSQMVEVVGRHQAQWILMHMRGGPQTMQTKTHYDDVVAEVRDFLQGRAQWALAQGLKRDQLILDPGLGFAKTAEQNWQLLRHLGELKELGYPLLVGASRKSFIQSELNVDSHQTLEGNLAVVAWATLQGVRFLRVHEVAATARCLGVLQRLLP